MHTPSVYPPQPGAPRRPVSVRARLAGLSGSRGTRAAFLDAGTGETVSWRQIARQAAGWSALAPGTVAALRITSPAAFCRAYLAGLAAGVCLAPLDPRATPAELAAALTTLEAATVVTDGDPGDLTGLGAGVWVTSAAGLRQARPGPAAPPAPGTAVLLPTSGTTGRPKLVPLTEPQLLRTAAAIAAHHRLGPAGRGYSPLPLFHVNAQVVGVLSTLVSGGSLVVDDRFHGSRFWAAAAEFGVTWLNLVPAILGILGETAPPPAAVAAGVRFARSASAPLPAAVQHRFEAVTGIGVLETYGMTEAASQITASPLRRADRRPGSAGLPTGVTLRITTAGGREAGPGETGTVELRGPTITRSYLGPGRTPLPARGPGGWLRTGDLAFRDGSGFVYLTGRTDDVINRGGEKLSPRDIEEVLLADPRVRTAVVVGRPHRLLGQEPVAYVVTAPGTASPERLALELLGRCRHALSPHKQPASVTVASSLPAGPTGKPNRTALRAAAAAGAAGAAVSIPGGHRS